MNLILSIVRPSAVQSIKNALIEAGLAGFTVSEVHGHGRQKGHTEHYRGAEYEIDLLPKSEIKVVVSQDKTASTVEIITKAARTGKIGDGKIFVIPVQQVFRIRTGETGPDAL
jgi:nitrogen regulatory protein PII